jgi:AraC-like DNA-binding protein
LLHALDFGGDPIAALYIEPDIGGLQALAPLLDNSSLAGGAIVGSCGEISYLRMLFEDRPGKQQVDAGVAELIGPSKKRSRENGLDPRIKRAVRDLRACSDDIMPVAWIAETAGLSSSRFQHLFSAQVGVPYRRYRSWSRMRVAIREIAMGRSCTMAAHAAGYADLAHFTRDCRRTFGGVFTRANR